MRYNTCKKLFKELLRSTVNETLTMIAFFKAKESLIPSLIFLFTLQRLVSDDFYLWEGQCWIFFLRPRYVKHFADRQTAVRPCCENHGKPDSRWLFPEKIVTSMLEKSSGSLNWFSFLTRPAIKAKSTNCKSVILIWFVCLLFHPISEFIHLARCVKFNP